MILIRQPGEGYVKKEAETDHCADTCGDSYIDAVARVSICGR